MTVSVRFQIGGHPAADWTQGNPVLLDREFAAETDTGKFKLGNGQAAWKDLPYQPFWSKWGRIEGSILDQADLATALVARMSKAANLGDLSDVAAARANLALKALALRDGINGNDWSGADLGVGDGGTGASSAAAARTNLGAAASGVNTDITSIAPTTVKASGAISGGTVTAGNATSVATMTIDMSGTLAAGGIYRILGGGGGNPSWDWGCSRGPTSWSLGYTASGTRTEFALFDAGGIFYLRSVPTYATDAAAASGGLPKDAIYKTATGELRIKL